jgi:glutamate carboxypeptidase
MSAQSESKYGRIDPMLTHLEALVKCESPSDDINACREVVELANEIAIDVLGVASDIREINGRPVFWWGDENPAIVLLSHLDTVWPKGSFEPLWKVEGDIARGPGIFDMKAGFIQGLFALKGISGSVALVATTDEEIGSGSSKQLIEELAAGAKAVLVLEASVDGKVKTGRKGTSMYQITVHGRAAHAGLEPEKGINATIEIANLVLELASFENAEHGTTVVPTVLRSGNTTNTVPDHAVLDLDVRSFSNAELLRVDVAIRALKPVNSEASIQISGGLNRPPLELKATKELYELAKKVAAELNMTLDHAAVGGASDGNFAAAAGARVLDGLGAVGEGAHAKNEWVSIKALQERSDFLHAFIKELLND